MQEISSQENGRLKAFIALYREKRERDGSGLCVLDGVKICRDAASAGIPVRQLWVTDEAIGRYRDDIPQLIAASDEVYVIKGAAARKISELAAPQGVFAAVEKPPEEGTDALARRRRILGLCGLQNPENVGSCVRSAAALGYGAVLLSSDCADIWSPRALRAGAGTQLFCSVSVSRDFVSSVRTMREAGVLTCASALHTDSMPVTDVPKDRSIFLAVGSEGNGLPDEVTEACELRIRIPMSGSAESLNAAAAAAVMMWELRDGSLLK